MNLVVFLMRNMTLRLYDEMGLLEREMALYRRLVARGVRVALVTYGDRLDFAYRSRLGGVRILCNWPGWSRQAYERRLVWLHAPWLWRADVVKADQTDGADVALWSARRWRRPVVARCGYLHDEFAEREWGAGSPQTAAALALSARVFTEAAHLVVTTQAMADSVVRRHGVSRTKLTVIPNYVDTALFRPDSHVKADPRRVCTLGRLAPQKNLGSLIAACAGQNMELTVIGTGPLESELRAQAGREGASVRFLGNVSHADVPRILRECAVFVLPSHYEGHPKALLEAMACGRPVLGTDVAGIREVIRHGETGWLCAPTAEGLRAALASLLADAALRARLGGNARGFAVQNFALDRVATLELDLYQRVLAELGSRAAQT